jgi:hypothetical protein
MIKKTITFEDLDGNTVTDDFYFHMSKAEITQLELSEDGGFSEYLKKLIGSRDGKTIIEHFTKIILAAYGERSVDNRRFIKSKELSEAFQQTDAFSTLFMELISDEDASSAFILGIVPSDVAAQLNGPHDAVVVSPEPIHVNTNPEPPKVESPFTDSGAGLTPQQLEYLRNMPQESS